MNAIILLAEPDVDDFAAVDHSAGRNVLGFIAVSSISSTHGTDKGEGATLTDRDSPAFCPFI